MFKKKITDFGSSLLSPCSYMYPELLHVIEWHRKFTCQVGNTKTHFYNSWVFLLHSDRYILGKSCMKFQAWKHILFTFYIS